FSQPQDRAGKAQGRRKTRPRYRSRAAQEQAATAWPMAAPGLAVWPPAHVEAIFSSSKKAGRLDTMRPELGENGDEAARNHHAPLGNGGDFRCLGSLRACGCAKRPGFGLQGSACAR